MRGTDGVRVSVNECVEGLGEWENKSGSRERDEAKKRSNKGAYQNTYTQHMETSLSSSPYTSSPF